MMHNKAMHIVWNKVTWYSKLAAVIFFIAVFPTLTFYIGREYQETVGILSTKSETQKVVVSANSEEIDSGIYGIVYKKGTPFQGGLRITSKTSNVIVETTPNSDGNFFILLPAGDYTISSTDSSSKKEQDVSIQNGVITRMEISLN
jgi:hypothetical protein